MNLVWSLVWLFNTAYNNDGASLHKLVIPITQNKRATEGGGAVGGRNDFDWAENCPSTLVIRGGWGGGGE